MPVFGYIPWLPRVVFWLSLWVPLATINTIQPPAWPSQEPSDLSGLNLDGPPWASLVLSVFAQLSRCTTSHLTVPRTIWSERTWSGQSPWPCSVFPFVSLLRMVPYITCCAFIIYLLHTLFQWFLFCFIRTFFVQLFLLSINDDYCWLLKLLFDYCL